MQVSTSKVEAAVRQCDVAIELLFTDADPFAIRTLAAAALGVLADLNDFQSPKNSWRQRLIDDSDLPSKAVVKVLHAAQNFLKHASDDPDGRLTFEEKENDLLLFLATLECGQLGHELSFTMQAFQIWFLATAIELDLDEKQVTDSRRLLPGIELQPRAVQLARGAAFHNETVRPLGVHRFS